MDSRAALHTSSEALAPLARHVHQHLVADEQQRCARRPSADRKIGVVA
jgi:hypothetical protein